MPLTPLRILGRIATFVAITVAIIGMRLVFGPKFTQLRLLGQKRAELEQSAFQKQKAIDDLKRKQLRFQEDPEFVEHIARQNRRVRPGEVIFIFGKQDE